MWSTSHRIRMPNPTLLGADRLSDIFYFPEAPRLSDEFAYAASDRLSAFLGADIAAMGSSGEEEHGYESIKPQGVNEIQQAGKQEAGRSSAGEKELRSVDSGDPVQNSPGVPKHGAGDLPKNVRVAKERQDNNAEFEKDLEEQDERERLLAEKYRVAEEKRVKRAERWRKRDGRTTPNPDESSSNPDESASNSDESDRDTTDDTKSCYIEIRNLVLIENSKIHKKALEEWDRKQKLFAQRQERKTTKVESRKNEVYQLIGFFIVFQGVVLTAVSQSNLLHCNNTWSPILLSALASIVTIAGVSQKLSQIWDLEKTIFSEHQALQDVVRRGEELRREGKDFVFAKFSECRKKESKKDHFRLYLAGVLSSLVGFAIVFPVSYWRILCHPGRNPYVGAPLPA